MFSIHVFGASYAWFSFFLPCKNSCHVKKNNAWTGFSYHAKNPCHVKKNNAWAGCGYMNLSFQWGRFSSNSVWRKILFAEKSHHSSRSSAPQLGFLEWLMYKIEKKMLAIYTTKTEQQTKSYKKKCVQSQD